MSKSQSFGHDEMDRIDAAMMQALTDYETFGEEYAQARADARYLDELTSVIKSEQMRAHPEQPVSHREIYAKSSDEYKSHLLGLKEAIYKENSFYVKKEKAFATYEAYRSKLSLERAKMQLL